MWGGQCQASLFRCFRRSRCLPRKPAEIDVLGPFGFFGPSAHRLGHGPFALSNTKPEFGPFSASTVRGRVLPAPGAGTPGASSSQTAPAERTSLQLPDGLRFSVLLAAFLCGGGGGRGVLRRNPFLCVFQKEAKKNRGLCHVRMGQRNKSRPICLVV